MFCNRTAPIREKKHRSCSSCISRKRRSRRAPDSSAPLSARDSSWPALLPWGEATTPASVPTPRHRFLLANRPGTICCLSGKAPDSSPPLYARESPLRRSAASRGSAVAAADERPTPRRLFLLATRLGTALLPRGEATTPASVPTPQHRFLLANRPGTICCLSGKAPDSSPPLYAREPPLCRSAASRGSATAAGVLPVPRSCVFYSILLTEFGVGYAGTSDLVQQF